MNKHKVIATELNAIIQNYLYEKLGDGAEFSVQYNEDNIHVWVRVGNDKVVGSTEIKER